MGRRPTLVLITFVSLLLSLIGTAPAAPAAAGSRPGPVIVVGNAPDNLERLAAQELRRYLYLLTGSLARIADAPPPGDAAVIVIGRTAGNPTLAGLVGRGALAVPDAAEGYAVKKLADGGRPMIAVLGAQPRGVLYGSYRLLEQYGARFYLSRDALPAARTPFELREVDLREQPSVAHRGLLPWHDFLNGPSAYSPEDFQRYIDQMVKMRMNTLVLHNYTGGYPGSNINEPFMRLRCNGADHEAWLDTSVDNGRWGLATTRARDMAFRAGDYMPHDVLGSDAARYTKNQPDAQENIYRKAKTMMRETVEYAQRTGVDIVLGTDFDVLPTALEKAGCKALDPAVLKARLDDILETYPTLKYIQMYFGEVSDASTRDGIAAYKVMRDYLAEKRPWAKLVTGSWFREDRFPEMHQEIQPDTIFSTLLPHDMTVRDQWSRLPGRERWPVPWMEFDGGLSEPQLAVKRMEQQLPKLRAAGVEGMIGILWRERAMEPNVAYLAQDSWQPAGRALPAADFYRDFARANFGAAAAEPGAAAFDALETGGVYGGANGGVTTPEYAKFTLCGCERAAKEVARYGAIAERFRALEPLVSDPGGRDNLDFWRQFLGWLDGYWKANEKVPAAAELADPPSDNYFLVDSGGTGEKDLVADKWYHSNGYNGFTTPGTVTDDFGYPGAIRSEQWSSQRFGYTFPIPEGYDRYRVELYFQEGYFGVPGAGGTGDPAGKRVFDIDIDGSVVRDDFDVAAAAGGSLKGVKLVFDVPVPADRKLDVDFVPVVSNPKIDIVRAYPIDAAGQPLPPSRPDPQPGKAWETLTSSGFQQAIDSSGRMVRDLPLLGGLLSSSGGRWAYNCPGCVSGNNYEMFERKVVEKLPVAPPTDLVARGAPHGARLTWAPYPGRAAEVAGYHLYRAPAAGGEWVRRTGAPVTGTAYTDAADGTYRYAVTAVTAGGEQSPRSFAEEVAAGKADRTPPRVILLPRADRGIAGEAFPVAATVVDGRSASFVSAELRYRALGTTGEWRSVPMRTGAEGEPYTFYAAIPAGAMTAGGVEYYVAAGDAGNKSVAPAARPDAPRTVIAVEATGARPGAPGGVTVTPEAGGASLVSWRPASGQVSRYRIYRGGTPWFTPGPESYLTYVTPQQRAFRDVTAAGKRYHYKIIAVGPTGRTGTA